MKIERLDKNKHDRNNFNCGEPALNNYLKAVSGQHDKKDLSRTCVLTSSQNGSQIKGYYSLALCTVELDELPEKISKKYPSTLHCALIGRLAISKSFQRQGFGEILLIDAIRKAIESSKSIPTPMIIVDAKNDIAKKLYMNVGFEEFLQTKNKLFMSTTVAIEMIKKVDAM
ncbi:N-acetyltransferase [Photorhabdus noenieputensis]|uniref:GNAT family N-acetyltransferase n=1 Tax=Photorhabdus noenieputensis TaxID=1208607 RepID=UPI001BD236C1|nr:GNAT family N-acetyltransferase [Photorhabdus noenieputensis]MBS9437762.1 N-acetyltransferase [Photorhabdus noenieputensis]MCK3667916.1 GNAT family N-acetyltransferase [Photorhabdus noenieputensis]